MLITTKSNFNSSNKKSYSEALSKEVSRNVKVKKNINFSVKMMKKKLTAEIIHKF